MKPTIPTVPFGRTILPQRTSTRHLCSISSSPTSSSLNLCLLQSLDPPYQRSPISTFSHFLSSDAINSPFQHLCSQHRFSSFLLNPNSSPPPAPHPFLHH
uniref:Uncharacterized protein n=1 Tax=Manihot esculenta TaxID=3983 RepID=A0A2C9U4Z1_MANES